MPKTLEDARKLISSPLIGEEEDLNLSGRSSIAEHADENASDDPLSKPESKLLDLVGGRRTIRERSADSTHSGGSGKRVAFAGTTPHPADRTSSASPAVGPGDAVGNLMNSFNPLSRFSVPGFSRFGRSASGATPPVLAPPTPTMEKTRQLGDMLPPSSAVNGARDEADLNAAETLAQLRKTKPPLRRFVDLRDAREMKIGEVEELLRDYKRLAEVMREAINA